MLKKDVLKANAVLAALTDEQIAAIETLSSNDETTVLGQRIGEIYREMDTKIATITGIQRNGDEKTYFYLERAAKDLKTKAESVTTLNSTIESLTKEKQRLEKAIQEGASDAETVKQFKQVKAELDQTKTQYTELQNKFTEQEKTFNQQLFETNIGNELSKATSGIKFKPEIPASVTAVLLQNATANLQKAYKPDFIDNGEGGKRLVFRNESGAVLNNPENQLNPYTAAELLAKELKTMGVIDEGRKAAGAGTPPSGGGNSPAGGGTIDLTGARTRVEAHEVATKALLAQGLTKGSAEFDTAMTQVWKDNSVSSLPEN